MGVMLLFVSLLSVALGQVSTGAITGTVTDAQQARLVGARLKLTSLDTNITSTVKTNDAGEYTFPLLNSGRYRLTAEAPGFQISQINDVTVELGRTLRLDITMILGQVTETINVSSTAPLLDSESSTTGQFIENKTVTDMPLNGRRIGDLLGLAGNAIYIQGDVIRPRGDDRRRPRGPAAVDARWRQCFQHCS